MIIEKLFDTVEEMKKIYPFDDERTRVSTVDPTTMRNSCVWVSTKDEETGIEIQMRKNITD